jgi:hypothetical protein
MSMSSGGSGGAMSEINVTPMVDVMLVLLIIFMVTAPLMQQGVKVNLPETKGESLEVNPDLLVLTITADEHYFIGKTEVTQKQWEAVMGTPMLADCGNVAVGDNFPVYCVTWNRIEGPGAFMEKLNEHLGTTGFRLPTEAEWERAARANTTTRFSHGDVLQCDDDCGACAEHDPHMWFCGNNSPVGPKLVGTKQANPFGLHDMHGNLFEIVRDRYADDYGSGFGQSATDPIGAGGNGDIVLKGGGAVSEVWLARSAMRISSTPGFADQGQNDEVGFRVATSTLASPSFEINAGLNDAWVSADAPLQGMFFTIFENLGIVFMSWFTFDSVPPGSGATAAFGAPDQRWVTGAGAYSGNTVTINVENTSGGVFNGSEPMASQQANYGTITIVFVSCNEAILTYNFPAAGLSGEMTLTRVLPDNIALCEMLATP